MVAGACSSKDDGDKGDPSKQPTVTNTTLATSITKLIKTGIAQAQSGQFDDARNTFNNVLDLDPGNKFAWYNIGLIAQINGNDKAAITNYDKALETDPVYTSAMYNKALIVVKSDLPGGIEILQEIVDIDPKASTAYLQLGLAYQKQNKDTDAQAAFTKAVELDPKLAADVPAAFR